MKNKTYLMVIPMLFLLGIGVFFHYQQTRTPDDLSEMPEMAALQPAKPQSRLDLHPLADPVKLAEAKRQQVGSWEEWQDATLEVLLGELIMNGKFETRDITMNLRGDYSPEELASSRAWLKEALAEQIRRYQGKNKLPPEYPGVLPPLGDYQGPQTPEALIAEFDHGYIDSRPDAADLDTHYPKAAWLQRFLTKGAIVKDIGDYKYYLDTRWDILLHKENPDEWRSGKYGIPITTNFDEYTEGFIQRKVWENSIVQKVSMENNTSHTTVYFPSNHPDKYLPVVGKMTYVRFGENRESMFLSGAVLTDEQSFDLRHHGIEPEGIEIVYLDDDYNILPEIPPRVNERTRFLQSVVEFDGIKVTPENYETLLHVPAPDEWLAQYERSEAQAAGAVPDSDAIRMAARDAALQTQDQFQQGLRELERFANMSEAEIEAELERRLLPQMPELPTVETIENRLWSEVQSAQMTPARFEAALKILEQYGPEEGMQRLSKADPKAAAQVQRIIGHPRATERPPTEQPAPGPQDKHLPLDPNR